jgi:hypothetical protein
MDNSEMMKGAMFGKRDMGKGPGGGMAAIMAKGRPMEQGAPKEMDAEQFRGRLEALDTGPLVDLALDLIGKYLTQKEAEQAIADAEEQAAPGPEGEMPGGNE